MRGIQALHNGSGTDNELRVYNTQLRQSLLTVLGDECALDWESESIMFDVAWPGNPCRKRDRAAGPTGEPAGSSQAESTSIFQPQSLDVGGFVET